MSPSKVSPDQITVCISGASFIFFGVDCFTSAALIDDFRRFGMTDLRGPAGVIQFVGGFGLLAGLRSRRVLILSSGGLAFSMLVAFAMRLRARDSVEQSTPSLAFMLLNLYILSRALKAED